MATRPMEEFYRVRDVAKAFDVHENTVRRWLQNGELPYIRMGQTIRVRERDVLNMVRKRQGEKLPSD